jgi:hypothetical protein
MSGSSTTIIMGTSGRDRRSRARVTTAKRIFGLLGGILLLVLLVRGINALRRAGLYTVRVDRSYAAGDVHQVNLSRSESSIVDILQDDPDNPVEAGETIRNVSLKGRAKLVNVDGRGVPTRIILKVESLREEGAAGEQVLLENSEDIGVTRRVGGVFDIACKVPLSQTIESALGFVLIEFMRPIPRDLYFNTLVVDSEERRLKDEWDLDSNQLKLYGEYQLGGTLSSGEGKAQLPRRDVIGNQPCLVLLTHSEFKGMQLPLPAGYRSFGVDSFTVSTAHSLPFDLRRPAMSRSITTILKGNARPRNSQVAEVRVTNRVKVVEDIN